MTMEDDNLARSVGQADLVSQARREAAEVLGAMTTSNGSPAERPGCVIGRYRLLQEIGHGGFGAVFMAEQREPVQRMVALKVIKLGMDTRQVIARFEQERQALAMMDHPNIARVLDGGATASGRPYFVMELVRGETVTRFCDGQRLSVRQRLSLFIDVCHAVQHAHTKGIIHRDLKPSNVLVAMHDDQAVPKVIDFGIAKATQQRLTDKTLFTEFHQFIGTPEYMSPEQAQMSGLDIDTRSDVYSLGVLLYELLTGVTPFDRALLRRSSLDEFRRIIAEVDPPKPSTRLSSLEPAGPCLHGHRDRNRGAEATPRDASDLGSMVPRFLRSLAPQGSEPSLSHIAAHRRSDPASLTRGLRGDLDWIVMRCLEKDRTRRYETASALAQDVQRHLGGEPIHAAPPSRRYRLRKFVRRHRVGVVASATVALALVVGLGGTTWGVLWAMAEAAQARQERDKAERIASFMESTLEGVEPQVAAGRDTKLLKELMDAAADRIREGELSAAPEAELRLRLTIGNVYGAIAQYPSAHAMLDPAPAMAASLYGAEHAQAAEAIMAVGHLFRDEGKLTQALGSFQQALLIRQRLYPGDHADLSDALCYVHTCLFELGRYEEALPGFEAALAMSRRLYPGDDRRLARDINNVAALQRLHLGRFEEALGMFEEVLSIRRRLAKGVGDPSVAAALLNLASCYWDLDRPAEALPLLEDSLSIRRRFHGNDHPDVALDMMYMGLCQLMLDQDEAATTTLEQADGIYRRAYAVPHWRRIQCLHFLSEALRRRGRLAEAELHARESVQLTRHDPELERGQPRSELRLAHILLDAGRSDEAIESLRQATGLRGERPEAAALLLQMQAFVLLQGARPGAAVEAEALMRECLAIGEREFPQGHPRSWLRHNAASLLGEALGAQGRFEEAEPMLLTSAYALKACRIPSQIQLGVNLKQRAIERLVELYERWDTVAPDQGHDANAAEWRTTLTSEGRTGPPQAVPATVRNDEH